jgi:hypothetical protein
MNSTTRPNPETTTPVSVLRGAAGTGKSTIAREICSRLQAEGRLGASFFFVRSDASDLGSTKAVFPTIAFQLATLQPAYRPQIANAAREYMKLQSGSLEDQMKKLIIEPVSKAQTVNPRLAEEPVIIVLDALDEAGDDLVGFLNLLKYFVDAQNNFRIFVTTRPESYVAYAFGESGIDALKTQVDMEDVPHDVITADIQRFLQDGFAKLRWRNDLLAAHPYAIEDLTTKAERLFIYARIVIKHLDHKFREISLKRLAAILDGDTAKTGMSALDELYSSVLRNVYDVEAMEDEGIRTRVIAVLFGLVLLQDQVTVKLLAPLMGLTEDAAISTIEDLRSIISCSGRDLRTAIIRPLHLTLREYLVDDKRCVEDFYIDRHAHHLEVAKNCLRILIAELQRNPCKLNDANAFKDEIEDLKSLVTYFIPAHLQYACRFWSTHLLENEPSEDSELRRLLEEFCKKKLLSWIETMSILKQMYYAKDILPRVHSWTTVCVILRLRDHLLKFTVTSGPYGLR